MKNTWRVEKNRDIKIIYAPNGVKVAVNPIYFSEMNGFGYIFGGTGVSNKLYSKDGILALDNLGDSDDFSFIFPNETADCWIRGFQKDGKFFLINPQGEMLAQGVSSCGVYCNNWYWVENRLYNSQNRLMGEAAEKYMNLMRVYENEMYLLNQGENVFQLFTPQGEEIPFEKNEKEYLYQNGYRLDVSDPYLQILYDTEGKDVYEYSGY